ncbi:MAG: glycosyltransferase [Deltaproteobacteria bacterium]|nr:glycosyltransferase [Deltaproteobacteria bacterium]
MKISVVVTCLNEEENIRSCLESLCSQDCVANGFEVVVSDGASRDRTQEIVREIARADHRVRLVVERKKGTAAGRNTGIRASVNDFIAFIDADCEAPPDWLRTLATAFEEVKDNDSRLAAVGGANRPHPTAGRFVHAVGIALDTYLGSFSSVQGRQLKVAKYVEGLSTSNALYRKTALDEVGLYDESLMSEAEDADLNFRLRRAGYKFLYLPQSYVWHHLRSRPVEWFRNMYRYGKGRARLLKRHRSMWQPAFVLPPLFLVVMVSVFLVPWWWGFCLPLLYFPFIFSVALIQCLCKRAPSLAPMVALVYIVQHFGYSFGEVYGLLNPKVR